MQENEESIGKKFGWPGDIFLKFLKWGSHLRTNGGNLSPNAFNLENLLDMRYYSLQGSISLYNIVLWCKYEVNYIGSYE